MFLNVKGLFMAVSVAADIDELLFHNCSSDYLRDLFTGMDPFLRRKRLWAVICWELTGYLLSPEKNNSSTRHVSKWDFDSWNYLYLLIIYDQNLTLPDKASPGETDLKHPLLWWKKAHPNIYSFPVLQNIWAISYNRQWVRTCPKSWDVDFRGTLSLSHCLVSKKKSDTLPGMKSQQCLGD